MGLPLIDRSRLGQPQLGTRWDRASLGSFVGGQSRRGAVLAHGSWLGLGAAPPEHRGHCLDAGVHGCSVVQSWPGASETCFDA